MRRPQQKCKGQSNIDAAAHGSHGVQERLQHVMTAHRGSGCSVAGWVFPKDAGRLEVESSRASG